MNFAWSIGQTCLFLPHFLPTNALFVGIERSVGAESRRLKPMLTRMAEKLDDDNDDNDDDNDDNNEASDRRPPIWETRKKQEKKKEKTGCGSWICVM